MPVKITGVASKPPKLVTVLGLAGHLKLPASWLKAQAQAGRIPSLRVGRRLLFNPDAVERVLLERARQDQEASGDE